MTTRDERACRVAARMLPKSYMASATSRSVCSAGTDRGTGNSCGSSPRGPTCRISSRVRSSARDGSCWTLGQRTPRLAELPPSLTSRKPLTRHGNPLLSGRCDGIGFAKSTVIGICNTRRDAFCGRTFRTHRPAAIEQALCYGAARARDPITGEDQSELLLTDAQTVAELLFDLGLAAPRLLGGHASGRLLRPAPMRDADETAIQASRCAGEAAASPPAAR